MGDTSEGEGEVEHTHHVWPASEGIDVILVSCCGFVRADGLVIRGRPLYVM